jgi:prophage regulatory protein
MQMKNELISIDEVSKRVTLGKTCIYALIREGEFPRQIHLSKRRVAWVASDIDEWIEKTIKHSQGERENYETR